MYSPDRVKEQDKVAVASHVTSGITDPASSPSHVIMGEKISPVITTSLTISDMASLCIIDSDCETEGDEGPCDHEPGLEFDDSELTDPATCLTQMEQDEDGEYDDHQRYEEDDEEYSVEPIDEEEEEEEEDHQQHEYQETDRSQHEIHSLSHQLDHDQLQQGHFGMLLLLLLDSFFFISFLLHFMSA